MLRRRDVPATSRRSSVVKLRRRDVWSTTLKVKELPNFRIIKSTGDLIFGIIEGRMDESEKQSRSNRKDRKDLCFCISLLKTINDL